MLLFELGFQGGKQRRQVGEATKMLLPTRYEKIHSIVL
jgi:hypothetical protein